MEALHSSLFQRFQLMYGVKALPFSVSVEPACEELALKTFP